MAVVNYITSFEEVDSAIGEKLRNCVVDGNPVPVTFYSPDIDFRTAPYPGFVIYRVNEIPALRRESSVDDYLDGWTGDDPQNPVSVDARYPAEPWDIYYQIRLMTKGDTAHLDMDVLKMYFRKNFPLRYCYATIKGVNYDMYFAGQQLTGSGYKDFGITEEGDRRITESYLIKVEINLDIYDRTTKQLATEPMGIRNFEPT